MPREVSGISGALCGVTPSRSRGAFLYWLIGAAMLVFLDGVKRGTWHVLGWLYVAFFFTETVRPRKNHQSW
jgi:hypothetical protein